MPKKKTESFKILTCEPVGKGDWKYVVEVGKRQFKDRFNPDGLEKKVKKLGTKDSLNYKILSAVLSEVKKKNKPKKETQDVQHSTDIKE